MKLLLLSLLLVAITSVSFAQQSEKQQDKKSIKAMCGCYEVTFKYAETFPSSTAYKRHEPYTTNASAEWIFVDEETENKVVIQHLLLARDTIVIKHWRQDWLYENSDFHDFEKNNHWQYASLPKEKVKGQWTQKVYQVDDGPRYEGSASWIQKDGKHFWENTTDAPLPRREYTKRDDYNVMERRNRHEITDYGWLHEQDNQKIIRKNGKDSVLVMEKGYNIYKKIDASQCKAAKQWWEKNKAYWRLVRSVWNEVYSKKEDLYFQSEINDKKRWERLFELQEKFTGNNAETLKKEIREIIDQYITDSDKS